MLYLSIDPIAKPRMTQRDRWKQRPCVLRYREYCDALRDKAARAKFEIGDAVYIEFELPIPASWSKKKLARMDAEPHCQKPDIDNLVKAVLDALRPDDSGVWAVFATKKWCTMGSVTIRNVDSDTVNKMRRLLQGCG